jgi:hypothetical protein
MGAPDTLAHRRGEEIHGGAAQRAVALADKVQRRRVGFLCLDGDFLQDLPTRKHIIGCELSLVAVKWGKTADGGGAYRR